MRDSDYQVFGRHTAANKGKGQRVSGKDSTFIFNFF